MKKQLGRVTLAVATLALCSSAALAQSGVKVYGLVDLGITRFTGAAGGVNAADVSIKRVDNGVLSTSYIGFTGTEDLGSGLAASFDLNSFMRLDTGDVGRSGAIGAPVNVAADPFWSRNAWVGLSSRDLGRLRLGNFATLLWLQSLSSNALGDSSTVAPINMLMLIGSPLTGGTVWGNQVGYDSPNIAGFTAALAYSASENGGGANKAARLAYAAGPLAASLGWQSVKKNPATFADGTSPNNTRAWLTALSYDFTVIKVFGHLGRIQNDGTEATPLNLTYKVWDLSISVPVGAGNVLLAHGSRKTDDRAVPSPATAAGGNQQRQMTTLAYDHFLSKRTDLYAVLMHDRTVTNTLPAPGRLVGASATNLAFGIRHRF